MSAFQPDGTADCAGCALPLFPLERHDGLVVLECANRHRLTLAAPAEPGLLRQVDGWIARRGAQIHAQRERRLAEEDD